MEESPKKLDPLGQISFPIKTGGRIWKTVFAVFLCFLISSLRKDAMPIYAVMAAILCIQKNQDDSFRAAKNRALATLIGGMMGMLFLYFEGYIYAIHMEFLRYGVLSLLLIPIIHTTLWVKEEEVTSLVCIVFLSITVTHVESFGPAAIAFNRIADTMIGILVALIIDRMPLDFFKGKWVLSKPARDLGEK